MMNPFKRITRRQMLAHAGAALGTGLLLPTQVGASGIEDLPKQISTEAAGSIVFTHIVIENAKLMQEVEKMVLDSKQGIEPSAMMAPFVIKEN